MAVAAVHAAAAVVRDHAAQHVAYAASRDSITSANRRHHHDLDGDAGSPPSWKPAAQEGCGFVRMLYEPRRGTPVRGVELVGG